jgi:aldehyde dehydrogenase (NAD+)
METTTASTATTELSASFTRLQARSTKLRSEGISARADRLRKLDSWLRSHRQQLEKAVHDDLRKPAMEVETSELFPVLAEINHALENIDRWTAPVKIDAPLTFIGTRSEVRFEPKGTCLIIAPWNYPFNLCIG